MMEKTGSPQKQAAPQESGQQVLSAKAEARFLAAQKLRQERLAQALRDNLRRRKVQGRGRSALEETCGE